MRKITVLLAIICSVFVGASMAVVLHMLNGNTKTPGNGPGAISHNMPVGMSHEEHLKLIAAQNSSQQAPAADSSAPAAMDHNMPPGMSHEEHLKMMAAAKQQNDNKQSTGGDKPMDHSSMPTGMDHNMPPGMSHEEHLKMMAAAKQQNDNKQSTGGDKPVDHSSMPTGVHSHHPGQDDSPDPRPEFRAIKSLTADEVKAYEEGTGHGMAKAAEQNHYPGPRHILDLAKELQLSNEQIRQIEAIKNEMSAAAIPTGKQVIETERKLNLLFAQKKIDQAQLEPVVAESAALQGKLRLIHLSAHLKAEKILSKAQIDKYDELRGHKTNVE